MANVRQIDARRRASEAKLARINAKVEADNRAKRRIKSLGDK